MASVRGVLAARASSVLPLVTLLRTLPAKEALFEIFPTAIRITVENSRTNQLFVHITSDLFDAYEYTADPALDPLVPAAAAGDAGEDADGPLVAPTTAAAAAAAALTSSSLPMQFSLNLETLLHCLTIFGNMSATSSHTTPSASHAGQQDRRYRGGTTGPSAYGTPASLAGSGGGGFSSAATAGTKAASLRLHYSASAADLLLVLEDGGVTTSCQLHTLVPQPLSALAAVFLGHGVVAEVMLRASVLAGVFHEFDDESVEALTFRLETDPPQFQVEGTTFAGAVTVLLDPPAAAGTTSRSTPMAMGARGLGMTGLNGIGDAATESSLEAFRVEMPLVTRYQAKMMEPALRVLAVADRVQLRINAEGCMSLRFAVPTDRGTHYVESLIPALISELDVA
ncbi:hypothetical protein CXG81DRAFT_20098 [Caulochytrium protostelioides]|uniref:Rad1-domain-containing protein n=1 Tax=Caulochytrium protostelioides TaxID=1555241 RepID=A0A4V1IUA3_9FUNG|nr:hypothetical protein CXG81DRAFT_20098 [Caulochytrium protostelioides]|eukprot:RKO99858.1 hypothetical protein CXG81DRAFT_20098 [Caulochytrium protostelioides]